MVQQVDFKDFNERKKSHEDDVGHVDHEGDEGHVDHEGDLK